MPENDDSGMDSTLYGDEGQKSSDSDASKDSVDEESADNPTALLPLSAFGGKAKPGDTFTGKVIKNHDDEVEVEISQSSGKEPESETTTDEDGMGELEESKV